MNLRTKLTGVLTAFALVFSGVASVQGATTAQLIDLLVSMGIISADQVDVVQAAVGGTTTTTVGSAQCEALKTAPNMTVGAEGMNVTNLQNWLIAEGHSIPAGATGYFGAQTQSALAAYQAANGIAPAAGFFGPITRASITCTPVVPIVQTNIQSKNEAAKEINNNDNQNDNQNEVYKELQIMHVQSSGERRNVLRPGKIATIFGRYFSNFLGETILVIMRKEGEEKTIEASNQYDRKINFVIPIMSQGDWDLFIVRSDNQSNKIKVTVSETTPEIISIESTENGSNDLQIGGEAKIYGIFPDDKRYRVLFVSESGEQEVQAFLTSNDTLSIQVPRNLSSGTYSMYVLYNEDRTKSRTVELFDFSDLESSFPIEFMGLLIGD